MSTRPFRILGLQQIAIGGPDKGPLRHLWLNLFGLEVTGTFRSEKHNVDEDIVQLGHGVHAVEVDLMMPIDPGGRPRVDSPPLNHIGLWVDDLPAAIEWLGDAGVRFIGEPAPGAAGHDIVFIHPKGSEAFPFGGEGVLIELVQAPSDVIAALSASAR